MTEKWTREGFGFTDGCPTGWLDLVGQSNGPCSTVMFDRLMADANKWAANEAAFHAMADAIKAHRDGQESGGDLRAEHRALLDALKLAEPEPEALTITVPPDTAEEIVALLTKVAKLLEQKGGK